MYRIKYISLFLILIFPCLVISQPFVYLKDTAILTLQGIKFGNINWQLSSDSISWTDIPGANGNDFPFVPDSTYYYRAQVTEGTCIPFFSDVMRIEVIFQCGDTLIDYRDGQRYPTVLIGSQCWLAKNLNIGVMIINGTQNPSDNGIIEKYCYNNDTNNCNIYGGLYDWNEMMHYTEGGKDICPCGWHIPSDEEWMEVEIALGMDSATASLGNTWRGTDQGIKLMVGGSSGYNALLSGSSLPGGLFNVLHEYEFMHTSTPFGSNAWRRCVRTSSTNVGRWNTFPKNYGLSIRCIKN